MLAKAVSAAYRAPEASCPPWVRAHSAAAGSPLSFELGNLRLTWFPPKLGWGQGQRHLGKVARHSQPLTRDPEEPWPKLWPLRRLPGK